MPLRRFPSEDSGLHVQRRIPRQRPVSPQPACGNSNESNRRLVFCAPPPGSSPPGRVSTPPPAVRDDRVSRPSSPCSTNRCFQREIVGAVICNHSLITAKGIPSANIRISLARKTTGRSHSDPALLADINHLPSFDQLPRRLALPGPARDHEFGVKPRWADRDGTFRAYVERRGRESEAFHRSQRIEGAKES